ncbi:MAG: phosphoglucosamine mutase [Clostridiales bacterium]|nr:phosphoglucosamine mutase [Bacillota bacterium]MEE0516439.1 phosphoglucosamine mutase [Anaerovoracaceae bacterium]PWL93856.1 MAG: phosphoglucosamine mutase [Clostridiales bacterium]
MGRLFGTDGVRGVANKELTPELAFNLGKAGTYVLKAKNKRPVVVIGKDTRISGDMLENALVAGILAVGGNVIKLGVIPTPAVAYLARYYNADAGIVISASHNTFEYNGIKFFNGDGYKLDDLLEEQIEDLIISSIDVNSHITGEKVGRCLEGSEDAAELYAEHLLETVDFRLDGIKVVLDCANGAAYEIAPRVYKALGADVSVIGNNPDGININDGCGSTHPEKLAEMVKLTGADIGLAFDGDADRLIVVDEKGNVIDGDRVIAICAKMLKKEGRLAENKVTATVMSNIGFHKAMEASGIDVDVTGVGDRYVLEKMLETGCVIGGEQSGHIIFKEYTTTGDGVLSSLQFMKALKSGGKKPSQLAEEIEIFPQVLVNAKINNDYKKTYMNDEDVSNAIKEVESVLADNGRVLIRPSGTEPLVRVMLEGSDQEQLHQLARKLADLIEEKFR